MPNANNNPSQVRMSREEEKEVKGMKRLVRRGSERFRGEIKGVDLGEMHEDFFDVDVLKKN